MHVGFVTSRYAPHTGGVETHVERLATRLVNRGHIVTVIAADAGPAVTDTSVRDGVLVRRLESLGSSEAFHAAPGVVPLARRQTFDVIHAHNYHSFPMTLAALGARAPVVCTPHYHGTSSSRLRRRLLALYRPIGRRALDRADRVLAVSSWERDRLAADFDCDATVVPNGIDTARFETADRPTSDHPTLLTVGRLVEYKGVEHAIRALSDLPGFRLRVAGNGPDSDRLKRIARETGVADRVRFLGYVTAERLPGEYASADVFVSMSSVEASGIVVGEALAAGTPAVVRPKRGLADWTRRADCVAAEPATLADAVARAQKLSAPAEPIQTWDGTTDAVERVYRAVVTD